MIKTIWKFALEITGQQRISIPSGYEWLAVQEQHGGTQLWALVDPTAPVVDVQIEIHGTGHPIDGDPGKYIGTFQAENGFFVGHVFEKVQS